MCSVSCAVIRSDGDLVKCGWGVGLGAGAGGRHMQLTTLLEP